MVRLYTTMQGDTWDQIAKRALGDEYLLHEIINVNPEYRETVIFPANVQLRIPDIPDKNEQAVPAWLQDGDDDI